MHMSVHSILCNVYEYVNTTIRTYHEVGKFDKFCESSMICQTKLVLTILITFWFIH